MIITHAQHPQDHATWPYASHQAHTNLYRWFYHALADLDPTKATQRANTEANHVLPMLDAYHQQHLCDTSYITLVCVDPPVRQFCFAVIGLRHNTLSFGSLTPAGLHVALPEPLHTGIWLGSFTVSTTSRVSTWQRPTTYIRTSKRLSTRELLAGSYRVPVMGPFA